MTSVAGGIVGGIVGGISLMVVTEAGVAGGMEISSIPTSFRRVSKISTEPMRVSKLVAYGSPERVLKSNCGVVIGRGLGGSRAVTGSSMRVAKSGWELICGTDSGCGQYGQN